MHRSSVRSFHHFILEDKDAKEGALSGQREAGIQFIISPSSIEAVHQATKGCHGFSTSLVTIVKLCFYFYCREVLFEPGAPS
jgi:hypothetical protein